MATQRFVLGLDLGTGGARGLLVDQDTGVPHAHAEAGYEVSTPRPGWSEQDPADWWRACLQVITQLLSDTAVSGGDVACVGLAGQMHGLVLLGADQQVLRPAILWNDQRTLDACRSIHDRLGQQRLIEITGKPAVASFTAPKLCWVRANEPEIHDRIHHILLPKDFIRLKLSGQHAMDVTDASGTSWLDISSRQWSREVLDALAVDPDWLPDVIESQDIAGAITAEAAALTGLRKGTPVVAGAGDQAAAGIACGIDEPRTVSINLGTSGVVFAACEGVPIDPTGALHTFCHAISGTCHLMGCMLSAGGSLRWYRDTFQRGRSYSDIVDTAGTAPPGCGGLRFYPYLSGERTPHNDPTLTASFTGITTNHNQNDFARAVLEGILYGLKDGLDLVTATGQRVERIRMTGGGARSSAWRQLAADIFGLPVATLQNQNGSGSGAALLAMVGSGRFDTVERAMAEHVSESSLVTPTDEAPRYRDRHAAWQRGF
jgi:xylulokinase